MSTTHFDRLEFRKKQWGGKAARFTFSNGYGASVVCWDIDYSNGIDTYELAIIRNGKIVYDTPLTNDVLGDLTKAEVETVLIKIKALPAYE